MCCCSCSSRACGADGGKWGGNEVDVAFLANTHLAAEVDYGVRSCVAMEGEVVETAVGEAVAVIYSLISASGCRLRKGSASRRIHLTFFSLAISPAFASTDMLRLAPLWPARRPASWVMRGVGITSWFLLPSSTCYVVSLLGSASRCGAGCGW